jgi:hypothetical protein
LKDTLQILRDSLYAFHQANIKSASSNSNYFNYTVGVIGVISAVITFYLFYQWYKSKKLQDFVYKQAQLALEKESTQEKLNQTKEELTNVESRLTELQKQIQKDLPIEARKAVLKDRLEESLENLKKYFDDVISTKTKLSSLGETNTISAELLKNIQHEIEPRFIIKEKISNYKTYLTIVSTLAGVIFAIIPRPFNNYIGGTLLLIGLPIAFQLFRLSLIKKSKDKQSTNRKIIFWISVLGAGVSFFFTIFLWVIILTSYQWIDTGLVIFNIFLSILTLILFFISWKLYRRLDQLTKTNQ